MSLDEMADTTVPGPSSQLTAADLAVEHARHRRHRLQLMHDVIGGYADLFDAVSQLQNVGIACESWSARMPALKVFRRLMDAWPGQKDPLWSRGDDENLVCMEAAGMEWEKVLVHFYAQTYFNSLGYPPILPRHRR
ncbi:hypothetical protein PQX77_013592 [Marasmius sp. AFHP31]|nr:hypothetical protein PQX77_013592 [Marasmius sp. AFHP31]